MRTLPAWVPTLIRYGLGLGLGAGLLYLALSGLDMAQIWADLGAIAWGWLAGAMGVALASHFLRGARWRMQFLAAGYAPSTGNCFAAVMTMYMVNQALPRAGELAQCTMLLRSDKIPLQTSLGTIVAARALDVLILLVLLCVMAVAEFGTVAAYVETALGGGGGAGSGAGAWVLAGAAGLGVAGLGVAWALRARLRAVPALGRVWDFGAGLASAAWSIRKVARPGLFVAYSFGIWIGYWMMTYLACFCFSDLVALQGVNLGYFSFVVTVMGGVGMAMPVPGGIGPYHAAVKYTFGALLGGVLGTAGAQTLGLTFAFALHSAQLVTVIAAGALGYAWLALGQPRDSRLAAEA